MIKFKIITPDKIVFEAEIDAVTLPSQMGEITILPNHIPLISLLVPGEIKIKKNKEEISLSTSGGFVEITGQSVVVLSDTAERAEEIDIAKAEEAKVSAEKMMKEKRVDSEEFARMSAKIEKELARLKVARKRKFREPKNNIESSN